MSDAHHASSRSARFCATCRSPVTPTTSRSRSPTRSRASSSRSRRWPRATSRTAPCRSCSWRSPSCSSPAAGSARTRTSSRTSGTSRTLGPEPDVDELRERLAELLEPIDVYSEVFDPYEPAQGAGRRAGSPTTSPTSSPTCATAWPTTAAGRITRGPVVVAVLLPLQLGLAPPPPSLRALQSLVAHVRLDQPLEELDGLDTDAGPRRRTPSRRRPAGSWPRRSPGPLGLRDLKWPPRRESARGPVRSALTSGRS